MTWLPPARVLLVTLSALVAGGGCGSDLAAAPPSQVAPAGEPSPGAEQHRDDRPALRVLHGQASYYGDSLAGNLTASGERYDPRAFTAAHRSLPFGTIVRVVRADGRGSVTVRITDRGPFGRERRILDLSRAAAEQLHMIREGVVEIRAEILEWGAGRRRR